eukprot:SRR837773.27232.p1 GENE.SRR837773.27232~~SRR837773.27232.p1  ORF type:complete len:130 (-),score=11.91 SRR837773.27232:15-371(-)
MVDVKLAPESFKRHGYLLRQPILVSVDEAEDVVAHVRFRQKHGPDAPLPDSLQVRSGASRASRPATWVVLDVLDLLLALHRRNTTACSVCALFLHPIQQAVEIRYGKTWASNGHDPQV